MKSVKAKDGSSQPPEDSTGNPSVNFKGEKRCNDAHESTTDPETSIIQLRRRCCA